MDKFYVAHRCVLISLRGQYCFTVCVKAFGPLTRNYYVRAFLHAAWVPYLSCYLCQTAFYHCRLVKDYDLVYFVFCHQNPFVFVFFPQHLCTWRFYACHCSRMCLPWDCQPHLPCSKFAAFNPFIFLLSSKLNNFLIKLLTEAGTGQLVETRK